MVNITTSQRTLGSQTVTFLCVIVEDRL